MRRLTIIILTVILIHAPFCNAQKQSNWDEALDRYELLCQRCLELMDQQKNGAVIPRESITSLVTQLSLLKNTLSEARGSMTAAQKSRFDLIRRKFSGSGAAASKQTKKAQETKPSAAQSRLAGADNHKAPEPSPKENVAESHSETREHIELPSTLIGLQDAGAEAQTLSGYDLIKTDAKPQRMEKRSTQFLAALQAGVFPDLSYGGLVGFMPGKFGAYLKYRNDFHARGEAASYTCDAEGYTPQSVKIWPDGTERRSRTAATAGAIWRPWERAAFYAGAGYGTRYYDIRDIGGNWARVSDLSAKGLSIDIGAMFMPGRHFFAGAGIDFTAFRYTDLELTIGLRF